MAPALNCFLLSRSRPELWETTPRYVLDCVAVKLHNMEAIPSTGLGIPALGRGTAGSFSRAARPPEECYVR